MDSVVEVYLSEDQTKVHQVKCLIRNRCKTYIFDIKDYIKKEMQGYKKIKNIINKD